MTKDLISELEMAHQIIRNALSIMTPLQRSKWAWQNSSDKCDGEGTTRANERIAIICSAKILDAK